MLSRSSVRTTPRRPAAVVSLALALAVGAPLAADEAPYGVNAHAPEGIWVERHLAEAVEAGISWIRIDFSWSDIEREPGLDDWSVPDAIVAEARRRGLRVLAALQSTPAWATDGPPVTGVPRDAARWAAFCARAAARYRGGIHAWGVWNEPNLPGFFSGTRQQYVDVILRPAAAAIHAADPDAKVAAPDLAHLGSTEWYRWLQDVLSQAASSIDVVTHHVYDPEGTGDVNEKLDANTPFGGRPNLWGVVPPSVREVLLAAGQTQKPFWLTEVGWASDAKGEAFQAAEVRSLLTSWFGTRPSPAWVKKVFVYELVDDGRPGIARWGLLRADLSRKPAFDAYRDAVAASPAYGDAATAGSLAAPPSVAAGEAFTVRVTVRNAGRTTWSRGAGYILAPAEDAGLFTAARVALPETGVAPGAALDVGVPLVAPPRPGRYRLAFQLARDGAELFGPEVAQEVTVTGSCAPGTVPELTARPAAWVPAGSPVTLGWTGGLSPFVVELWKGSGFGPSDLLGSFSRDVPSVTFAAPAEEAGYGLRVASSGPCGERGPFTDLAVFAVTPDVARLVPVRDAAAGWIVSPGNVPPPATVRFLNGGTGASDARFDVTGPFTVSPSRARLGPGEGVDVTVVAAPSVSLSPGLALGRVVASYGDRQASAAVALAVTATRASGVRPVVSADTVVLRASRGGEPLPATLLVTNPAAVPVALVPAIGPGGSWLGLDPSDLATPLAPGETRRVRIGASRSLRLSEDGAAPVRTVLGLAVAGGGPEDRVDVSVVDAEPGPLLPPLDRGRSESGAPSFVVPSVTRVTGAFGQRFRSTLVVRNPGPIPATVDLFATPLGASGHDAALRVRRTIPAATTLVADDVLGTLFGRTDELTAHLEVRSDAAAAIEVRSVTHGEPSAEGSRFGAEVPVVASGEGTGAGRPPLVLSGVLTDDTRRVNLILAETSGAAQRVGLRLFDDAGRTLAVSDATVPAWGSLQSALLPLLGLPASTVLSAASLQVEPLDGDGRVAAIATVIDNASSSFSVLTGRPVPPAQSVPDPAWVVPSIVHSPGLTGFFTTDLFLTNAGVRSASLALRYSYAGPAGGGDASASVVLGPKASLPVWRGRDAVVSLFRLPAGSSTSGTLRIEGLGAATLVARATVSTPVDAADPSLGTMAAELAASTSSLPGSVGEGADPLASVAGLRLWPRERVNLLVSETAGAPARVLVEAGTDGNGVLHREELALAPREKRQLTDLQSLLGVGPLDRLWVGVRPSAQGGGQVRAAVTVIDNRTGSSQVVPLGPPGPRPLP